MLQQGKLGYVHFRLWRRTLSAMEMWCIKRMYRTNPPVKPPILIYFSKYRIKPSITLKSSTGLSLTQSGEGGPNPKLHIIDIDKFCHYHTCCLSCMFIVSHATVCFCMFLVGSPQTPEPVIPPGRLACTNWPILCWRPVKHLSINQSINPKIRALLRDWVMSWVSCYVARTCSHRPTWGQTCVDYCQMSVADCARCQVGDWCLLVKHTVPVYTC